MGNCPTKTIKISDTLPPRTISFHSYRSLEERELGDVFSVKPANWDVCTSTIKAIWEYNRDVKHARCNAKFFRRPSAVPPPKPRLETYLRKYAAANE